MSELRTELVAKPMPMASTRMPPPVPMRLMTAFALLRSGLMVTSGMSATAGERNVAMATSTTSSSAMKPMRRTRMLQRRLMGVGLTRGHDIIRVVVVRDGLALGIGDLARDGGKLILRKGILEHEGLAVGCLERAVRLLLIDDAQTGGIVDRGSAVEIASAARRQRATD